MEVETTQPQTPKRKATEDITPGAPKKPRNGKRLRRFVFTLNNYTKEEEEQIQATDCRWLIYGRETGEAGTPHLQGACVIGRQVAFSTIKTWPGFARCHISTMNGKPEDSLRYCSKEDTQPFQKGQIPNGEGRRNDLHEAVARLRDSKSSADFRELVKDDDFAVVYVKYNKGLTLLSNLLQAERDRTIAPKVVWIHGPTGTGKTRSTIDFADKVFGLGGYWLSAGSLEWFDGYGYQKCAILDDLRTQGCKFAQLLRLLDRYQYRVPIKGGFVDWIPEYIFITAPMGPRAMWSLKTEEQLEQLERRCTYVLDSRDGITGSILRNLLLPGVDDRDPTVPGNDRLQPVVIDDDEGGEESEGSFEDPRDCPDFRFLDPEEAIWEDGDNVFAKE